jgi:hypothetical protein|tara:strand:- start:42 stop:224 length:183 start_codon:yes stop_codon:yes gene_type:complete
MIQNMIVEYLFNEENKKKLIEEMNKAIDIPFIGEKTEAKVLDAVWDSVEEVLKNAILKSK